MLHQPRKLLMFLAALCLSVSTMALSKDTVSANLVKQYPARNAYELATRLYQYERGDFRDNAKYRPLKIALLNAIKVYIDGRPDSLLNSYTLLDSLYKRLANDVYPPAKLLYRDRENFNKFLAVLSNRDIKDSLSKLYDLYKSSTAQADQLDSAIEDSIKQVAISQTNIDTKGHVFDSIKKAGLSDTTELYQQIIALQNGQNKLLEKINTDNSAMLKAAKDTSNAIDLFLGYYDRHFPEIERSFEAKAEVDKNFRQELDEYNAMQQTAEKATQDIINNIQYNIEQANPASSFRIPTQAEMIDALAIYLAKRVKQEAVMWFFEQVKKNTDKYELIREFFPNTIRLLQGNEVYEIPNMGTLWHYALSKDFTLMPKNVMNSKWLATRSPEAVKYKDFINGACNMAELMERHYSYRETIQALYLKGADNKANITDTSLGFYDLVRLFYTVNTEFFIPDSNAHYRLLNFSDYSRLNKDELILMLSLADIRYQNAFQKVFNLVDHKGKFAFSDSVLSYRDMQILLGRMEASISAFEKMRSEFAKKDKQDNNQQDWVYTTYSVWSSLTQMLDVLELSAGNQVVFNKKVSDNSKAFKYAGILYESYDLISKKNYAGAVQNMLGLVDTLLYRSNPNDSLYRFSKNDSTKKQIFESSVLLGKLLKIDSFGMQEFLNRYQIKVKDGVVKIPDSVMQKGSKIKIALDRKKIADTLEDIFLLERKSAGKYIYKYKGLPASLYEFHVNQDTISFAKQSPMASVFFEQDRHAVLIVQKLSGFLNDAALSDNDKQLARVVESYAMPPGSYKRKRNNWWSLDLNAFAGGYIGYEWLPELPKNDVIATAGRKSGGVYGFSVPIGLAVSKTFGRKLNTSEHAQHYLARHRHDMIRNPDVIKLNRNYIHYRSKSTLTATISIVDLGAVVSYRMTHGDSVLPQSVKWEQFISPGLHLSYAISGTPLVATLGGEYTPKLRQLNDATEKQYNTWRIYTGIFFDLPILNLWEKRHRVVQ